MSLIVPLRDIPRPTMSLINMFTSMSINMPALIPADPYPRLDARVLSSVRARE